MITHNGNNCRAGKQTIRVHNISDTESIDSMAFNVKSSYLRKVSYLYRLQCFDTDGLASEEHLASKKL